MRFNKEDRVYIGSPLSAPMERLIRENMKEAARYVRKIAVTCNCRAIAPHSFLPYYLDDTIPEERAICLEFGLSILKLRKALIICGDRISSGMKMEIITAVKLNIPIYRLTECKEGMEIIEFRVEVLR